MYDIFLYNYLKVKSDNYLNGYYDVTFKNNNIVVIKNWMNQDLNVNDIIDFQINDNTFQMNIKTFEIDDNNNLILTINETYKNYEYSFLFLLFYHTNKTLETTKIDCNDSDVSTVFSVSDFSNIDSKTDSVTKTIELKGTKNNNQSFGYLFFQNRIVTENISNKLFFNYSPTRKVDCSIYEDGFLILKGSMIVNNLTIDKYKNVVYNCTVTGELLSLKTSLDNTNLSDLDVSDLKHTFNFDSIRTGFNNSVYYPFIWYGKKFNNNNYNTDWTNTNIENIRPAVTVDYLVNKILENAGYKLEGIKGNENFISNWNKLIIPHTFQNFLMEDSTQISLGGTGLNPSTEVNRNSALINGWYWEIINPHTNMISNNTFSFYKNKFKLDSNCSDALATNNIVVANKNVNLSGSVKVNFIFNANTLNNPENIELHLMHRPYNVNGNMDIWQDIGSTIFKLEVGQTITTDMYFDFQDVQISKNEMIGLFIHHSIFSSFQINSINWIMPKNGLTLQSGVNIGDSIIPQLPSVGCYDFLKGIINMFNLYITYNKENQKNLTLETYDYYYSNSTKENIIQNKNDNTKVLNWSNKIDISNNIVINSNVNLNKSYLFKYKEDSDFLNDNYKKKYNSEIYGQLFFTDSLGTSEQQKIELPFSLSPQVQIQGSKLFPSFTKDGISINTANQTDVNIRILFLNQNISCENYYLCVESITNSGNYTILDSDKQLFNSYNCASVYDYQINSNNQITGINNSLYFGQPREYYFNLDSNIYRNQNTTLYSSYWLNKVSEFTDINLSTLETNVYLTNADIQNLDLRYPVFVDLGEFGNFYYKILSINYNGSNQMSSCKLQKIIF